MHALAMRAISTHALAMRAICTYALATRATANNTRRAARGRAVAPCPPVGDRPAEIGSPRTNKTTRQPRAPLTTVEPDDVEADVTSRSTPSAARASRVTPKFASMPSQTRSTFVSSASPHELEQGAKNEED